MGELGERARALLYASFLHGKAQFRRRASAVPN